MIQDTVTYKGFDGVTRTEDVYFHISRGDMARKIVPLRDRLGGWQRAAQRTGGQGSLMSDKETAEMFELLTLMIEASYGVRSEDKRYFRQNEQVLSDFRDSGAMDAYLFSLFENDGSKAFAFMKGIFPDEAMEEVDKVIAAGQMPDGSPVPDAVKALGRGPVEDTVVQVSKDEQPFDPNKKYSPAEFSRLTDAQKLQAFEAKSKSS